MKWDAMMDQRKLHHYFMSLEFFSFFGRNFVRETDSYGILYEILLEFQLKNRSLMRQSIF